MRKEEEQIVYNLRISKPMENFFASRILVHNCSLGCCYCFAYFFKSNNPSMRQVRLRSVNSERMLKAMKGEPHTRQDRALWKYFYKHRFLLHWGGLADPFCPFERENRTGLHIIKELAKMNYPTLFSYKGDVIFDAPYQRIFERYAAQSNFAFQASIITRDDELAKRVEVGVPSPTRRIESLKMLSDMGYWTILRLRPFIIGISDRHLDQLLDDCLKAGINAISTEFFALDLRATEEMKARYDWLAAMIGVDSLEEYFKVLSPSERGGYRRLNRLIKEPYIRKMYDFCVQNDILFAVSDPDFKELNMSGSCCGMPDNFSRNKELENWSRSQLTYHIAQARRVWHRQGKKMEFRFHEVFGDMAFLDDYDLAENHVSQVNVTRAERLQNTLRVILRRQWNNLKSPANPRNYFHGKLLPIDLDSHGDLIFQYTPLDYERRWTEEGIDLTK